MTVDIVDFIARNIMNFFSKSVLGSMIMAAGMTVSASALALDANVESLINDGNLDSLQKKALTQYAESLDTILGTDTEDRDQVIETNKQFMNAQQCLAQVYSRDQKPYMMRVSRKIYEATFSDDGLLRKYHEFLGQAQQEGDLALPTEANACKK